VKMLGECGVRRMLESMRAGCIDALENTTDNTLIVESLVDQIIQVENKQGVLSIKNKPIKTIDGKNLKWNERSIYKKPGIKTADGKLFFSADGDKKAGTNISKYGYRVGTIEEALAAGYKKDLFRQVSKIDPKHTEDAATEEIVQVDFYSPPKQKAHVTGLAPRGSNNLPASANTNSSPPGYQTPSSAFKIHTPLSSKMEEEVVELKSTVESQKTEIADLKSTVDSQAAAMLAMMNRMAKMEELMLMMSQQVFPPANRSIVA
jgi:hypothetical protein